VTFTRTWAIVGGVVLVIGGVAAVLAIADDWSTVEQFTSWLYPLPLVILLALATGSLTGMYVRERRRTAPKTYGQLSADKKEQKARAKVEARRTITLILNEVASNRRLMETSSSTDPPSRFPQSENWIAHRHALAELPEASNAYALTTEAYDALADIDDLLRPLSTRVPTNNELHAAAEKAGAAEAALRNLLGFIEGPRTRWAVSGVGGDE
jgi:hypothetical protein